MSTRSITHIHEAKDIDSEEFDAEETIVCSFYRHSDGYPKGHGLDLQAWLNNKKLVNGIGSDFREGIDFNRAGSMAIRLMSYIEEAYSCRVIPTGTSDMWEEYTYDIYYRNNEFVILVTEINGSAKKVSLESILENSGKD